MCETRRDQTARDASGTDRRNPFDLCSGRVSETDRTLAAAVASLIAPTDGIRRFRVGARRLLKAQNPSKSPPSEIGSVVTQQFELARESAQPRPSYSNAIGWTGSATRYSQIHSGDAK